MRKTYKYDARVVPLLAAAALVTGALCALPASATYPESRGYDDSRTAPRHVLDLGRAVGKDRRSSRSAKAGPDAVEGETRVTGLTDLVARDPGPGGGSLVLHEHNGSDTDAPWTGESSLGGAWLYADVLQLVDVTGDGLVDLMARDPGLDDGTLWIYPNSGAGEGADRWLPRYSAGSGWNEYDRIVAADVTGDGRPDLLTRDATASAGTLWIHEHDGSATGNPWAGEPRWAGTGWNLAADLLAGDVTGDGNDDILVRDGNNELYVYPHNGNLTGNPFTSRFFAGSGWSSADALMLGDVNDDGRADVVARDATGSMWIYPHNGQATGNPYTTRYAAGSGWEDADVLALGDVSGDGRPDVVGRLNLGSMWVYPHDDATPEEPWSTRFSAGERWRFENQLMLGDVTGDGLPDMIARDPKGTNGTLWVYPNSGAAGSDPWAGERTFAGTGWNDMTEMTLGDLTGDGWLDVLARDRAGDLWVYPHNQSTSANPWTGAPTWAGTVWNSAVSLVLGDVSGDGVPDLVDQEDDGSLWVYVTDAAGGPIQVAGDWSDTTAVMVGDLDETDGLDLLTRDDAGRLWMHSHNGAATGNPWPTEVQVGSDWGFASSLLLPAPPTAPPEQEQQEGLAASRTEATVSATRVRYGDTAWVEATVTGDGGTPTGQVQVLAGQKVVATEALSGGLARLRVRTEDLGAAGEHSLVVRFTGDALHAPSEDVLTLTVTKAPGGFGRG